MEEFGVFTKSIVEVDESDVGSDERGGGGCSDARRLGGRDASVPVQRQGFASRPWNVSRYLIDIVDGEDLHYGDSEPHQEMGRQSDTAASVRLSCQQVVQRCGVYLVAAYGEEMESERRFHRHLH